jgi:hypothetical protein
MSDAAFKQVCWCHDLESETERLATLFNNPSAEIAAIDGDHDPAFQAFRLRASAAKDRSYRQRRT